jgi:RNA polymerase sigma-70 factor, ECF subfamily
MYESDLLGLGNHGAATVTDEEKLRSRFSITSRHRKRGSQWRPFCGGNMSEDCSNDELQLISSAKAGNEQAFAALFNLHKRRVYSLCLHMSKDVAEAEDLTQDAFIRVYRKLSTFRGESRFSTWLYRIAVNTVLASFRKSKSEMLRVDRDIQVDSSFHRQGVGRGDSQLLGALDRITLLRAIEELPPGCRTVFMLHDVEGYEHHEVAAMLECSIGNSKAQLHNARLKIRKRLLVQRNYETNRSVAKGTNDQGSIRKRNVAEGNFVDTQNCPAFQGAKAF